MSVRISFEDAQKRLQAGVEVTVFSLDLNRAALQRYPELSDEEVSTRVREEIATYGAGQDG